MSRLYDRMIAGKAFDDLAGLALNATIVDVSAVFHSNLWLDRGESFPPLCVPPLDTLFVEYRVAKNFSVGVLFKTVHADKPFKHNLYGGVVSPQARHIGMCMFFFEEKEHPRPLYRFPLVCEYQMDMTGDAIGASFYPLKGWESQLDELPPEVMEDLQYRYYGIMDTCLFSFSLMNSKNVELIENIPPAKLSRKHEKKHGTPLTKYYTLKVNPMRTVQRMANPDALGQTPSQSEAIPRALHIARGHFKDYRDGPGLFGKYRDVFWWDQHVRGTKEAGEIVKDYEVETPDNQPSTHN